MRRDVTRDTWNKLKSLRPFSAIQNTRVTERLRVSMRVRHLKKRDVLVRQGERSRLIYLVLGGAVQSFTEHNGERAVCDLADGPYLLPLDATLCREASLHTWEVLLPTDACGFPVEVFETACERDAEFSLAVARQAALQHGSARRALLSAKLRTTNERLANWLLQEQKKRNGNSIPILSKKVLASHLGMAPANLSRCLALLSKHGLRVDGAQIFISDPGALAQFAMPNALLDGP